MWFRHSWLDLAPGEVPPENLRKRTRGPFLQVSRTTVVRLDASPEGFLAGIGAGLFRFNPSGTSADTYYIVPDWFMAALLALMPAFILTRLVQTKRRMQRRIAKDLCPSCGYDLRASPDRCPECGAVPAEKIKNSN